MVDEFEKEGITIGNYYWKKIRLWSDIFATIFIIFQILFCAMKVG